MGGCGPRNTFCCSAEQAQGTNLFTRSQCLCVSVVQIFHSASPKQKSAQRFSHKRAQRSQSLGSEPLLPSRPWCENSSGRALCLLHVLRALRVLRVKFRCID